MLDRLSARRYTGIMTSVHRRTFRRWLRRAVLLVCFSAWLPVLCACRPAASVSTPSPVYPALSAEEEQALTARRLEMVDRQLRGRGISDPAVLEAMQAIPRHLFVPENALRSAYDDHPLPVGYGQTISQPYIVAYMTELLRLSPGDRVLEIGTGSGYQAAVLAEMGMEVYSIEIIQELAARSEALLNQLGYSRVAVRHADGYYGWEEHAPYDAIIVTCAPDHIPRPLVAQLAEGGRMVLPVGPPGGYQTLWLVIKQDGQVRTVNQGDVIFVPLTGGHRGEAE